MREGNKTLARNLLEKSFENIKRIQLERYNLAEADEKHKIETNPKIILHTAIENCRPFLQLSYSFLMFYFLIQIYVIFFFLHCIIHHQN